jgi:hypothetical protein
MGDLIVNMLVNLGKGIRHAVNVRRKDPQAPHRAVEYVDALPFSDEDGASSDSSDPLPIRPDDLVKR